MQILRIFWNGTKVPMEPMAVPQSPSIAATRPSSGARWGTQRSARARRLGGWHDEAVDVPAVGGARGAAGAAVAGEWVPPHRRDVLRAESTRVARHCEEQHGNAGPS